jgi:hypothetical protein
MVWEELLSLSSESKSLICDQFILLKFKNEKSYCFSIQTNFVMLIVVGIYLVLSMEAQKYCLLREMQRSLIIKDRSSMPISARNSNLTNISMAALLLSIIMQQEVEEAIKDQAMKNTWKLYRKE